MKTYYSHYKERIKSIFAPGIKIWSNGIPLKADTWQSCINMCKFCYANELRASTLGRVGIRQSLKVARVLDLKKVINIFERAASYNEGRTPFMNWSIRNQYFIELGTTGEVFQEADVDFGVTYNFFKILAEYKIPVFINTKMNLLCKDDRYKRLLTEHTAPVIICVSLSTTDDKDGKIYEPLSPLPSERLRTIKELNQYPNIKTIVYTSPFMPGITDKNPEKYTTDLIDNGIISSHLRDFYMQGTMFQSKFWLKYKKEQKDNIEIFPAGHHATYESRKNFLVKMQGIAQKRNKDFMVVGMKSKWFDLNPYHGKMNYDVLPDSFKEGITDFTAIPLMRKIKENGKEPQLLLWNKLGYKKGKINLPEYIHTNEGGINNLMEGVCNCNTSNINYEISGYDWVRGGLWNGWDYETPGGFIYELDYVFPVKCKNKFMKDSDGNFVYAYLPKENWDLLVNNNGQRTLFTLSSTSDLISPYVEYSIAKGFLIAEREGGTEDKWLK